MMKCEIIRDLIPLYLDKVCSEDSRKLVEEHLAECSECRKYMKELETELEAVKQKKEEDLDEKQVVTGRSGAYEGNRQEKYRR